MADQLQIRRGTTAQNNAFTGAQGELTMDTDLKGLRVHDNITPGGFALATRDQVFNGTFYFNDNTGGGSAANAYILVPKSNTNAPTQYLDGQQFGFTTNNANTGPSTATFSGLGVKSLKYRGGIDPAAGDIFGRVYLIFDSSNDWFEIQRKAVAPPPQIRNITGTVSLNALNASMPAQTVDFRGTPITNGTTTSITFTSPIILAAPAGATLGTTSGALSRIVILALNNAGVVVLGLTNANNSNISFDETELVSTTAMSAAATSANVVYSAAGLSNVPYRVVGYIESTQATAGTWATSPSKVQGQGGQALIGLGAVKLTASAIQNTTSGTAFDFTGIPAGTKRITVMFNGVSTNGANPLQVQIGAGSVDTSGYLAGASYVGGTNAALGIVGTTGMLATGAVDAATVTSGHLVLTRLGSGATWISSAVSARSNLGFANLAGGTKTLSGELDRVRVSTVGGTDTFDLGSCGILYEG